MRIFNRLMSLLVGLALIGGGGFLAFEVILAAVGNQFILIPGSSFLHQLQHTSWSGTIPFIVVAAIAAGGVVLFLVEARPWRRRLIELPVSQRYARWWVSRRSVEARSARILVAAEPVKRARLALRPHPHRRWRLTVKTVAAPQLREEIETITRESLAPIGVPANTKVRVRVSRPRRVV
jgi:hypothetical protein